MTRVALGLLWLLQWLPLGVLAGVGAAFGEVAYWAAGERRRVTQTNLALCFPTLPKAERQRIARAHFHAFGRALVEHGIIWFGSGERVRRMVRIEGSEHARPADGRPVIWLAPHFLGLDMGGIRISMDVPTASSYTMQKNRDLDRVIRRGRERLGKALLFSRQDGVRPIIRALKDGWPLYYLPDMDFGPKESIFVPFFGVPAATVPALSRLAGVSGAAIVPLVTRQLPGGQGYVARFYPAWDNFPSGDVQADTRRMNAFIEERVLEMPAQYLWSHKRFKTRPPGEARFYPE
jgi:KDO2-lipid IV(A) lauroyltransferase